MPDLVALQEWPPESKKAVFWQQDWHIHSEAGLCIASRFPIGNVETFPTEQLGLPGGLMRCDLQTPEGTLHFVNVHLPTPRPGFEALLDGEGQGSRAIEANTRIRWQASELASRWAQERKGPVIVAGDFNMPEDCAIYRQFWSRPANGFAMAGLGWGHSKFTSHFGVRIDHVLAGSAFCFRDCQIGPDVRSDHRPVVADLVWTETSQPSGGRP
jgi:endonuclease/exonuclease/phosphatase family metal-dependent hydrolase